MGGEFRLFYPICDTFDIPFFEALIKENSAAPHIPKDMKAPEKRTDDYFVFPECEKYGLKLRYQRDLELKVRKKVKKCGAEVWNKTISKKINSESQIESILKSSNPQCLAQLQKQKPPIVVHVHKSRIQYYSGWSYLLEQTELLVEYESKTEKWCSICVEGSKLGDFVRKEMAIAMKTISTIFEKNGKADLLSNFRPMGYPEFCHLFASNALPQSNSKNTDTSNSNNN